MRERLVYEVSDTDEHGILIDLLACTLQHLAQLGRQKLKWAIFDLNWVHREEGILDWKRVTDLSSHRPGGWPLDDSGIRLFCEQYVQVEDGLFVGDSHHVLLPAGEPDESAMSQSEVALLTLDTSFWRLSCREDAMAQSILAGCGCRKVSSTPLVSK